MAQYRKPLCSYYSPTRNELIAEIQQAYLAVARATSRDTDKPAAATPIPTRHSGRLMALIVPHGAACDGFHVAAHAYQQLATYLKDRHCSCLTAVLVGTEHRGTTPIALSRRAWLNPLGVAAVNTAAVDYLSHTHHIPVNEAPHETEHAIENQLPFLVHAAEWGFDLAAAGCTPPANAARIGSSSSSAGPATPARLLTVPISVGYLGMQPGLIQQYGAAVADLLQQLQPRHNHAQQQQQKQQQQDPACLSKAGIRGSTGVSGHEVVLIVTSDFTHAGPWYREVPPAGVSLEDYMLAQDLPVIQAVQQGRVDKLLAAAAATHNSMCGLYPLAVAIQALYGGTSSSTSNGQLAPEMPELLAYSPAHLIFKRPDSTGFAAFAVYAKAA